VSHHPLQVSGLTLAHPHPPPSAQPINSPYAGPFWASAAKMGSHDGVISRLHRTRREAGSQCNSEPGSSISPPRALSSLSPTSCRLLSTAVVRSPISFFEPYASFSPFSAALHHIDLAAYLWLSSLRAVCSANSRSGSRTMILAAERAGLPASFIHAPFATLCRTVLSITAVPDMNTHVLFANVIGV
jgi:hypothetical protein